MMTTTTTAYERVTDALRRRTGYEGKGDAWRCPVHGGADGSNDVRPSLSVTSKDGQVLLHCHAGCSANDVVDALGLTLRDLFDTGPAETKPQIVASYSYVDESGRLLFTVHRRDDKSFLQQSADGSWKLNGVRRVLYRLPQVVEAVERGITVFIAEGEKDVHALESAGEAATCNAGGAGKWRDEYNEVLRGADVVIVADKDAPGRRHADSVKGALQGVASRVRVVEAKAGKDAADHLAAGFAPEEFHLLEDDAIREPEPTSQPVDGRALLDELRSFLVRYVSFPSPGAADAVTLWAAHTHLVDAFDSTPRLALLSPEKGSGKTRALEVLELVCARARHAVNLSSAALFRIVGASQPTMLFDEADTFFGPKAKDHEELRGLLNAGHRKGAMAYRCVGDPAKMEVRSFPAYCAVALAGIGDLPDTILDRAVLVRMRRRKPDETVTPFRQRYTGPEGKELHDQLDAWAGQVRDQAKTLEPVMPDGLTDRPADVWEPLLIIADLVGGDWASRAREAAAAMNEERAAHDPSLGVRLLEDIRTVFGYNIGYNIGYDKLSTVTLLEKLNALDESPWGDLRGKPLDARGLASLLRKYEIKPKTVRLASGAAAVAVAKGYERGDFIDAWSRYLPKSVTSVTEDGVTDVTDFRQREAGDTVPSPAGGDETK